MRFYVKWENRVIEGEYGLGFGEQIQVSVDIFPEFTVREAIKTTIEKFNAKFRQIQSRIRFAEDPELFMLYIYNERNLFKEDLRGIALSAFSNTILFLSYCSKANRA